MRHRLVGSAYAGLSSILCSAPQGGSTNIRLHGFLHCKMIQIMFSSRIFRNDTSQVSILALLNDMKIFNTDCLDSGNGSIREGCWWTGSGRGEWRTERENLKVWWIGGDEKWERRIESGGGEAMRRRWRKVYSDSEKRGVEVKPRVNGWVQRVLNDL